MVYVRITPGVFLLDGLNNAFGGTVAGIYNQCELQIANASGAGNFPPWYTAGKVWLDQHPGFPFREFPTSLPSS